MSLLVLRSSLTEGVLWLVFVPRRFLLPLFILAIWGFGVQTRFRWLGTTQAMFWVLWETGHGQAGGQLQGKAWLRQLKA